MLYIYLHTHTHTCGLPRWFCLRCRRCRQTWAPSPGQEDPPEEDVATNVNNLAWRIPCTEEPGRLQSIGSQSVEKS